MRFPGPLIGVVHLLPLPGSPDFRRGMQDVVARAVSDARAYAKGGMDALIVENYGDAPFEKERVAPWTVAAMTLCADAVGQATPLPIGINALRNDALAALGVATAVGALFIRVNVHAGVVATDQGLIEGRAAETLRARMALRSRVLIAADAHVKHGQTLHVPTLAQGAADLAGRSGADAVQQLIELARASDRGGISAADDPVTRDAIVQQAIIIEGLRFNMRRARVPALTEHPMRLPLQQKVVSTEWDQANGRLGVDIAGARSTLFTGSARPSRRAATFTPSPKISSPSTMISPMLMPMR